MYISKESLRGYILEEVLAYLIRKTGYELLIDPIQDPRELAKRGNGLVVKGRGAVHQVDVLGELKWIPAFTFPLRLIVEAKFRQQTTGIDVVRNAMSILLDVNQKYFPSRIQNKFIPKYHYVYSIFSTSGFSKPTCDLAIAHQISLVDLSGNEYDRLKRAIEQGATNILESKEVLKEYNRNKLVLNLRYIIRKHLGTLPSLKEEYEFTARDGIFYEQIKDNILRTAHDYGELFVGMANGPFMLLLKPKDHNKFLQYAIENPNHKVVMTWSYYDEKGKTWKIRSAMNPDVYELSFKLPEKLHKWIFETEKEIKETRKRALSAKQIFFSSITIYYYENERDYLFRLMFDLEATNEYLQGGL